jgi:hypothetical protein
VCSSDLNEIFEEQEEDENSQQLEIKIDRYIREFHEVDERSQNFRYHKDNKGKDGLEQIELINIQYVSYCINEISLYLEGIRDYLNADEDE